MGKAEGRGEGNVMGWMDGWGDGEMGIEIIQSVLGVLCGKGRRITSAETLKRAFCSGGRFVVY